MRSFRLLALASLAAVTAASAAAAATSGTDTGPLAHASLARATLAPDPVPEPGPAYGLAAGARRALEVRRQAEFELWVFTSLLAEAQRQAAFAAWVGTASQQAGSPAPSYSASRHQPAPGGGGGGGGGGGDRFAQIRQCESGGNYSTNTGNGYYGAYQFSLSTWRSLGYSGLPSDAPPSVQDQAAQQLAARSGFGQWPVCGR
ncbi:MAG TPA: transglycosylase family protein [Acidimicrobiales bacterium]|nr:transglycosylase family protein [Acidimicrobiales bacterium]